MQRGIEQEMRRSMTIPNGGGGVTKPLLLIAAAHDDDDGNKNNIINVASSNNLKRFGGVVKYMECLKNHAAAIGGSATDGCGEFMAGGEQGTLEALKCSACNCHRNFHRKKILQSHMQPQPLRIYEHGQQQQLAVRRNEAGEGCRKRLRTKFSQEQKEKMVRFAEKAEWKIQNADDAELRCFFEEIGVKRKVLKVWMHNNKSAHLNLQPKPN